MKILAKIILTLIALFVTVLIVGLGFLGYLPGLSSLLGADKPRDLGIKFTEQDRASARAKSMVQFEALPDNTPIEQSIQRSGKREVVSSWNSAEMSALMNDRPYRYWPIKNVQLKINGDGTAELSGVVVKEKLVGYAGAIGVPQEVTNMVIKFLPENPTFYVKAKTSLENNKVKDFDVQSVYLGKMPLPVNTLLADLMINPIKPAYAQNLIGELSKYQGKRQMIIDFINERLSKIPGFYAKSAYGTQDKLNFEGSFPEKESTVR